VLTVACTCDHEMKESETDLPYPAAELVPHRPPVFFLKEILERQGDAALVSGVVPGISLFSFNNNQNILMELTVEIIAQAMAAINGYDALQGGSPAKRGFLVGLDQFSFPSVLLPDQLFTVSLDKVIEFGGVTIMNGILQQDQIVAQGVLKVWEGD